ncbi:MAG: efflux RND transporter permease subunit [Alphaproteobacteria bacterium]
MTSIGFGLEKIAWIAIRRPIAAAIVAAIVLVLALFGLTRISFDEDMRNVFASKSEIYTAYVDATQRFIDPENELLLLIEGETIAEPAVFRRLQDLHFELQLTEGIGSVFSLFALRDPPDEAGIAPLVVDTTDDGLSAELAARIRNHPLLGAKLIAEDRATLLMVITPAKPKIPISETRPLKRRIETVAGDVLADTGLTITTSGFPVVRANIVDTLKRDQIVLNGVGAALGFFMSLIIFRSVTAAAMTSAPAIIGGLTVIGFMGLLGVQVTVMTTVVPAVVMILGYADGMHLSFNYSKARKAGASVRDAEMQAQREVGGACILAAITTSIAFAALTISEVELVRSFGLAGAVATTAGAVVVLVTHALLALAIGGRWRKTPAGAQNFLSWLRLPSGLLGQFSVTFARPVAIATVLIAIAAAFMHYSVPPQHSVREHLPADNPANAALGRIDTQLGGIFPIQVVLSSGEVDVLSPEGLARIGELHEAVDAVEGVSSSLSLWSLVTWLEGGADSATAERVATLLDELSPAARSRFINADGDAIVTGNTVEASTKETRPLIERVITVARRTAGDDAVVTGMTVITVVEGARTIQGLNISLTLSVIANLAVIAFAFRSLSIGLLSFLPNIVPIMAVGAVLYLAGEGMQFTSVIALTVAFGIAVDDTVHFLNRYRLMDSSVGDMPTRLVATARHVGPALFATTIVIITGMGSTLTSGLPTVALFGKIAAGALAIALIGDLIFLPALMLTFGRRKFDTARGLQQTPESVS